MTDAEKTALEKTDAAWERPPQEFIDRWNARCKMFTANMGKFNEQTGYFELNSLTDITYGEAINVDLYSDAWNLNISNTTSSLWSTWNINIRTNFPKYGILQQGYVSTYNTTIDVVRLHASASTFIDVTTFNINKLSVIKRFVEVVRLLNCTSFTCECPTLEHLELSVYNSDISLANCPLLDYASLLSIPANAMNTKPITVSVHANVMAKLTGGVKVFALDNRYDKAQWVKSTTVDNMEGYTPLVDSGLENGDYVVVHGTPTNDPNPYYFLGVVVGHRTDNTPQIKTLFGVQAEFDPSEYSDTQWHQILTDAAEKQITFATLT